MNNYSSLKQGISSFVKTYNRYISFCLRSEVPIFVKMFTKNDFIDTFGIEPPQKGRTSFTYPDCIVELNSLPSFERVVVTIIKNQQESLLG